MSRTFRFTVYGKPEPGGSKRAFYKPGLGVRVVDANKNAKPWKSAVASAAAEAFHMAEPMSGAVRLTLSFFLPRPKGHYGTGKRAGKVKGSAPRHHAQKPDVLKLARSTEDGMTGIVYRDDAQISQETLFKGWGHPPRCEVTLEELPNEP